LQFRYKFVSLYNKALLELYDIYIIGRKLMCTEY